MKPHFLASSAVFCFLAVVLLLQESDAATTRRRRRRSENIEFKDLTNNNNETCKEDLFEMDKNYFSRGGRKLKSRKSLDCFGLGSIVSNTLDFFLKKSANGTSRWAQKVKFYANSRNMPKRVALSHGKAFNLTNVDFDITRRTVLIVHGFLASGNEEWIKDMEDALLKWDDLNVFVVDWSDGSNTWNYYKAAVNTRTVGEQIATFFGQLVDAATESNEINPKVFGSLHFIGHSLGSHICGYASKEMKKRQNKWTVQRITGLDPAQPCFTNSDASLRLNQNDAPFVDIIHTNGRVLNKLGLGIPHPMGHIDFYPNGGRVQPGCALESTSAWNYLPLPVQTIAKTICSHGRSYLYFIDSIISAIQGVCKFWAHEWDLSYYRIEAIIEVDCKTTKCVEMGINSEKYTLNGTFVTITGKSEPYCEIDSESKKEVIEIIQQTNRKLLKKKPSCASKSEPSSKEDEILVIYD